MSYIPTEWKNGDVITAEKLNKLEEGVQEAIGDELIINVRFDTNEFKYVMDKEFNELGEAYDNGIKLKVDIGGAYLDFQQRSTSMGGYSYSFNGVFSYGTLYSDSSVPSLLFHSVIIEDDRIRYITKVVSLDFDTNS